MSPSDDKGGGSKLRIRVGMAFVACYLSMAAMVFLIEGDARLECAAFVAFNLCITFIFLCLFQFRPTWPYLMLFYSVFFLIYVLKGIVQYVIGLNSNYSFITIRRNLDQSDYFQTLQFVTLGHLVLATFLVLAALFFKRRRIDFNKRNYLGERSIWLLSFGIFVWTIFSSSVMYRFGVAVMGTTSIALPFGLSGVLFYSRTIAIPLLLLYFLEKALVRGDWKQFRSATLLFFFLAFNEVVVRATKSPMFFLILQIGFLYNALAANGKITAIRIKKTYVLVIFVFTLALWPAIEVYRTLVVDDNLSAEFTADVTDYIENQDKNFLVYSVERLFQRLLGFMQLSGLVADGTYHHDISIIRSYGTIGKYYTEYYLGYSQEGHLSSPSVLGTALIVGGQSYWHLVFGIYLILMVILWRIALLFSHMGLPLCCFLAVEVFNTFMAGTIDESFGRILLFFAFAAIFEFGFAMASKRVSSAQSLSTVETVK